VPDLSWREAIIKVLKVNKKPLHYTAIAQGIIDSRYRKNVGATPAASVAATLAMSLKNEGQSSPFFKPERGFYGLREVNPGAEDVDEANEAQEDAEEMGFINALGMFWRRSEVNWKPRVPVLMGFQQAGSQEVDFGAEIGVYLLHDGSRVVYVGQVSEPRLSARLGEHTRDRLSGRWDRFSWFGVRRVTPNGQLEDVPTEFTLKNPISTMEALLIEGLEPPQNRRQGNGFNAVEFLQRTDPELSRLKQKLLLTELAKNLD